MILFANQGGQTLVRPKGHRLAHQIPGTVSGNQLTGGQAALKENSTQDLVGVPQGNPGGLPFEGQIQQLALEAVWHLHGALAG